MDKVFCKNCKHHIVANGYYGTFDKCNLGGDDPVTGEGGKLVECRDRNKDMNCELYEQKDPLVIHHELFDRQKKFNWWGLFR